MKRIWRKMEKWKYENILAFRYHPLGSAIFLFIFYAAPSPYHRLRFPFNAFLIYDFLVFFSLSRKRMHSFLPYIQSNLSKGDIGTMCLRKHFSNRISSNKWTCEMEKSCTNTHTHVEQTIMKRRSGCYPWCLMSRIVLPVYIISCSV